MTLAEQVNLRRIARGKEPLRLSHIERAIRFIAGRRPVQRCALFQVKQRETGTDETMGGELRLRRAYTRTARTVAGRAG